MFLDFSFVLPVYNTPKDALQRCIDSISSLKISNYEIIIVNDGSNKETSEFCELLEKNNESLKLFVQSNQGVSVARNKGIKKSKGKFIIFVDPDDEINGKFQLSLEKIKELNYDLVLLNYNFIDRFSNVTKHELSNKLEIKELIKNVLINKNKYLNYQAGSIWAKVFKKDWLIKNKVYFNPDLRKAQDREFMFKVYIKNPKMIYLNEDCYIYHQNINSICNKFNSKISNYHYAFIKEMKKIGDKYFLKNLEWQKMYSKMVMTIYFETLYIDCFHYRSTYLKKESINLAKKFYIEYNVRECSKCLSLEMFDSISEKIKYMLIKNKQFNILRYLIQKRQTVAKGD